MRLWWAVFAFTAVAVGCAGSNRLVPFSVGKQAQYRFRWGVEQKIATIKVVREISVAGGTGWELSSPMGVVRLGYSGETLVADQLASSFMTPPMPIGIAAGKQLLWRGWVTTPRGRKAAKATIKSTEESQRVLGKNRKTVKTLVAMRIDGHAVELATWFVPGDGIVAQQQETDGKLEFSVDRVASE